MDKKLDELVQLHKVRGDNNLSSGLYSIKLYEYSRLKNISVDVLHKDIYERCRK